MKRFMAMLLAGVTTVSLAACGSSTSSGTASSAVSSTADTSAADTVTTEAAAAADTSADTASTEAAAAADTSADTAATEAAAADTSAEAATEAATADTSADTSAEASTETEVAAAVDTQEADPDGTHELTDYAGNVVEVPNTIDGIVIDQIPILSTYMAYFHGSTPYIKGFAGTFKDSISKTVLVNIAPELLEAQDTVYAQGDMNIEEIMSLDPDVIFYNANNKEHYEILEKTGIASVGFPTVGEQATPADPLTRYKEWLGQLEEVFGEDGKMDDFIAYGDSIVEDVQTRIAAIPEDERPTAMILFGVNNGTPQVAGKGVFGYFWLQHLGVRNVAEDTKGFAQVSFEQIYNWDPDVLFLNGPGLSPIRTQDVLDNTVEGADFSTLTAVKNQRVYNTTLGMWNWFTPNPDAPLVYAWLACKTYPEQFADYPLEDTIREYYSKWYGYEITDDEMKEMLLY